MSDHLAHYLALWSLSDPQPLTSTPTSDLYTVTHQGRRAVLKLLTPRGEEERSGAMALRYYDGHSAVRLLHEDENAHLLEYAPGDPVSITAHQGDDEGATRILAEVLNGLHSVTGPLPALMSLREQFRMLFAQADRDQAAGQNTLYTRAARIADELLAAPQDVHVLHGDMHHENVRWCEGRGWLAFDPKGLIGERTFDATNILRNPHTLPHLVESEARLLRTVALLSEMMSLDRDRLLAYTFAYVCLSATWWLSDGVEPHSDLALARLIEPHLP